MMVWEAGLCGCWAVEVDPFSGPLTGLFALSAQYLDLERFHDEGL